MGGACCRLVDGTYIVSVEDSSNEEKHSKFRLPSLEERLLVCGRPVKAKKCKKWYIYSAIRIPCFDQSEYELRSFLGSIFQAVAHSGKPQPHCRYKNSLQLRNVLISNPTDGVSVPAHISAAFVKELIICFQNGCRLAKADVISIVNQARSTFLEGRNIQRINIGGGSRSRADRLTVIGDLHGSLSDLLYIFNMLGAPSEDHAYLVNGDFVDRGSSSIEVTVLLCACRLAFPNRFFINRGNHESVDVATHYGLLRECAGKYDSEVFCCITSLFNALPLAAVVNNKVFVVHGGLSRRLVSVEDIERIPRREYHSSNSILPAPQLDLVTDLLWSDPCLACGIHANTSRGMGSLFGPDVVREFLDRNQFELIIRSHECVSEGYSWPFGEGNMLLTVFSSSNYNNGVNRGAVASFFAESLVPDIMTYTTRKSASPVFCLRSLSDKSTFVDLEEYFRRNTPRLVARLNTMAEDCGLIDTVPITHFDSVMQDVLNLQCDWSLLVKNCLSTGAEMKYKHVLSSLGGAAKNQSIAVSALLDSLYRDRPTLEAAFRFLDMDDCGKLSLQDINSAVDILAQGGYPVDSLDTDAIFDSMCQGMKNTVCLNSFLETVRLLRKRKPLAPLKNSMLDSLLLTEIGEGKNDFAMQSVARSTYCGSLKKRSVAMPAIPCENPRLEKRFDVLTTGEGLCFKKPVEEPEVDVDPPSSSSSSFDTPPSSAHKA